MTESTCPHLQVRTGILRNPDEEAIERSPFCRSRPCAYRPSVSLSHCRSPDDRYRTFDRPFLLRHRQGGLFLWLFRLQGIETVRSFPRHLDLAGLLEPVESTVNVCRTRVAKSVHPRADHLRRFWAIGHHKSGAHEIDNRSVGWNLWRANYHARHALKHGAHSDRLAGSRCRARQAAAQLGDLLAKFLDLGGQQLDLADFCRQQILKLRQQVRTLLLPFLKFFSMRHVGKVAWRGVGGDHSPSDSIFIDAARACRPVRWHAKLLKLVYFFSSPQVLHIALLAVANAVASERRSLPPLPFDLWTPSRPTRAASESARGVPDVRLLSQLCAGLRSSPRYGRINGATSRFRRASRDREAAIRDRRQATVTQFSCSPSYSRAGGDCRAKPPERSFRSPRGQAPPG